MTDTDDYRNLVTNRFEEAEKRTVLMLQNIRDTAASNHAFSEKQNDSIFNEIRELHKKVDIHNKYIMMLVGVCLFVTAIIPVLVVFLSQYVVK